MPGIRPSDRLLVIIPGIVLSLVITYMGPSPHPPLSPRFTGNVVCVSRGPPSFEGSFRVDRGPRIDGVSFPPPTGFRPLSEPVEQLVVSRPRSFPACEGSIAPPASSAAEFVRAVTASAIVDIPDVRQVSEVYQCGRSFLWEAPGRYPVGSAHQVGATLFTA